MLQSDVRLWVPPMTLWQWSVKEDDWLLVTVAVGASEQLAAVLRGYKRRSPKGTRFRWTEGHKPKKFRTRRKG